VLIEFICLRIAPLTGYEYRIQQWSFKNAENLFSGLLTANFSRKTCLTELVKELFPLEIPDCWNTFSRIFCFARGF
jgi:hypothetical protein